MDPEYSRDECVEAIRDYYEFLAKMFLDPTFIIEPPPNGWPNITSEAMGGLGKTDRVIELLRHLPYITYKPDSGHPHSIPGYNFADWKSMSDERVSGKGDFETDILMTQSYEYEFGGKVHSSYIGLMIGTHEYDSDALLLDTKCGVIYWMSCPDQVVEAASPKPSWQVHTMIPQEGFRVEILDPVIVEDFEPATQERNEDGSGTGDEESPPTSNEDEQEPSEGETNDNNSDEDNDEEEDSESDSDDDSYDSNDDLMRWGPCWPVPHFFEMLKNHFRQLNFIPKNGYTVVDKWNKVNPNRQPIPDGMLELLQRIYRKHGWPDLEKYNKEACLTEIDQVLNEAYPKHYQYDWD